MTAYDRWLICLAFVLVAWALIWMTERASRQPEPALQPDVRDKRIVYLEHELKLADDLTSKLLSETNKLRATLDESRAAVELRDREIAILRHPKKPRNLKKVAAALAQPRGAHGFVSKETT